MRKVSRFAAVFLLVLALAVASAACGDEDTTDEARQQLMTDLQAYETTVNAMASLTATSSVDEWKSAREDAQEAWDKVVTSAADVTEAEIQLLEAQVSNPYRRPMAAANVVVSTLVLIGSFLLSWRRALAQWWIKQAVAAKLIWIVAYTATLAHHIKLTLPPTPVEQLGVGQSEIIGGVVFVGLLSAGMHVAGAYRASRPDIRALVEAAVKARG